MIWIYYYSLHSACVIMYPIVQGISLTCRIWQCNLQFCMGSTCTWSSKTQMNCRCTPRTITTCYSSSPRWMLVLLRCLYSILCQCSWKWMYLPNSSISWIFLGRRIVHLLLWLNNYINLLVVHLSFRTYRSFSGSSLCILCILIINVCSLLPGQIELDVLANFDIIYYWWINCWIHIWKPFRVFSRWVQSLWI